MGVSSTDFEFSANADKVLGEMRKISDQQRAVEVAMTQAAKAAEKGANAAKESMTALTRTTQQQRDEIDRLRKKLQDAKDAQEDLGKVGAAAFAKIGGALAGIKLATVLKDVVDQQAAWNRELTETARKQDEVGRKLQVQALLSDAEFKKVLTNQIAPAATKAAVPIELAQEVSAELISQTGNNEFSTGKGLEELLLAGKGMAAGDLKDFSGAVIGFMKSQKMELTPENVRSITQPLFGLFKDTSFQASDLRSISGIGALLKNMNVKQDEMFAATTVLKDVSSLDSGSAATGVRNVALKLGASGANKEVLDTLRMVGGQGFEKQVDLVGESFPQALANLKTALGAVDKASQQTAMAKIFGAENVGAATTLMENLDTFAKFQGLQRVGAGAFDQAVGLGTSGESSRAIRLANEKRMAMLGQGEAITEPQSRIEALEAIEIGRGKSAWEVSSRKKFREMTAAVGLDPDWMPFGRQEDLDRARAMTEGAITPAALGAGVRTPDLGPVRPVRLPPTPGGPKRTLDFSGDVQLSPEEKQAKAARNAALDAQEQLRAYRLSANDDGKISREEKRELKRMEQAFEKLDLAADKLSRAADGVKLQRKNNGGG